MQRWIKHLGRGLFKLLFRVEVLGLEHYTEVRDQRLLIIANHVSLLDGVLLASCLPGTPYFAINTDIAQRWWARPFIAAVDHFLIDPRSPFSTKSIINQVLAGHHCVIFPEGRITTTGGLMKVFDGTGLIADKTGAWLLPVYLEGPEHSHFSYLDGRIKGQRRQRWLPKIRLHIDRARQLRVAPAIRGHARRQALTTQLQDWMQSLQWTHLQEHPHDLFTALRQAMREHGARLTIVEDAHHQSLTYKRLVMAAIALGRGLARALPSSPAPIGLLLPNANAAVVSFFALQSQGRITAMLNFSSGSAVLKSCCQTAGIRQIISSRRFIELARLTPVIAALEPELEVLYLEDLRATLGSTDRLGAWLATQIPALAPPAIDPEATAVILFTSGSEGPPKGVALSHRNLISNLNQVQTSIDFTSRDKVFNTLPMFHSFGLCTATLLPLLRGVRLFLYPSPLHYRLVPAMVYDSNATMLFGTDTFLSGYARRAHPYDFYNLRYAFAGAEPLRAETRQHWAEIFGVRILEGYGTTETAPVISMNRPLRHRPGTVGTLLPGLNYRLEAVPGIEDAGTGRLQVQGPNVMQGYLKHEQPGLIQPPPAGWHDTGDVVAIDDQGFIRIIGRLKRFAKIAGEMIALGQVETWVTRRDPLHSAAVIALPDPRKGEQLLLFTTNATLDRPQLLAWARADGLSELMVPRNCRHLSALPLLGTGKIDYPALQKLAQPLAGIEGDLASPTTGF